MFFGHSIEIILEYVFKLFIIILSLKLFKRNEAWLKSFLIFTMVHFLLIIIGNSMAFHGIHNIWLNQLIAWWIFLMYALVYYQYMNSHQRKKIVQFSTFVQILGIILIYNLLEPITTHPAYIYMVINTGIILNSLLAFHQIYQGEKEYFLERLPFFWINSSIFILYFSTTILFLIRNYVLFEIKSIELDNTVYTLISLLYNLADVMILVGILVFRRQMRTGTIQTIEK